MDEFADKSRRRRECNTIIRSYDPSGELHRANLHCTAYPGQGNHDHINDRAITAGVANDFQGGPADLRLLLAELLEEKPSATDPTRSLKWDESQ